VIVGCVSPFGLRQTFRYENNPINPQSHHRQTSQDTALSVSIAISHRVLSYIATRLLLKPWGYNRTIWPVSRVHLQRRLIGYVDKLSRSLSWRVYWRSALTINRVPLAWRLMWCSHGPPDNPIVWTHPDPVLGPVLCPWYQACLIFRTQHRSWRGLNTTPDRPPYMQSDQLCTFQLSIKHLVWMGTFKANYFICTGPKSKSLLINFWLGILPVFYVTLWCHRNHAINQRKFRGLSVNYKSGVQ